MPRPANEGVVPGSVFFSSLPSPDKRALRVLALYYYHYARRIMNSLQARRKCREKSKALVGFPIHHSKMIVYNLIGD